MRRRVDILHGVNLDQLGSRAPEHYGTMTLPELEGKVKRYATELDLDVTFWQTNHEGEYCEFLHLSAQRADGVLLNPGAWTHYSWAIHDALELSRLPAVEVHLSAIDEREDWRKASVIRDLCAGCVQGEGVEGYRRALEIVKEAMPS